MTDQSLSKSPERIARMFDAIAARYDFLNHLLSGGIDKRWRRAAVRALALTGRERVLDLCTGTADLAIAARTATPGAARVVGVDFAAGMLAIGRAKVERRALADSVALIRGDAARIPAASASVDAATVAFGIRNVENTRAVCSEIHRVLAPGGRVAILEFAMPTVPGIAALYRWYFTWALPCLGRTISRHKAAYSYLPHSVGAFASPSEFVKLLREAGFVNVSAVGLTFGIVYLYTGSKTG